jgi:hypothetical protein
MAIYKQTIVTSKKGINFVRSVVEDASSLFHKIEAESDLGIDALIELVRNETPLNKQFAVQIKSGQSYYNSSTEECLIPIGTHREYWLSHPLPVIGIVYVPALKRAHWIDIKSYLRQFPDATMIRYRMSEANRFDGPTFLKLFLPTVLREAPELSLQEALALFRSAKPDEFYLGLIVLFRRYPNVYEVWDAFIQHFIREPSANIPAAMVYFLAHIPWHGDIYYSGEAITEETRLHAKDLLSRFGRKEILKLLGLIDTENGISRGATGQSVEAIISSLPAARAILPDIATDEGVDMFQRECAALILAMNRSPAALPALKCLAESGSWYAQELINQLIEYGDLNPYA